MNNYEISMAQNDDRFKKNHVVILWCMQLNVRGVQRAKGPLPGDFRGQSPLNGGGENRTLVLSKHHRNHYMLSSLI